MSLISFAITDFTTAVSSTYKDEPTNLTVVALHPRRFEADHGTMNVSTFEIDDYSTARDR